MYEWLIPISIFVCVTAIGAAIVIGRESQKKRLQDRLYEHGSEVPDPMAETTPTSRFTKMLHRTGQRVSSKGPSPTLRAALAKAGYHGFLAAEVYLGVKTFLFLGGMVVLAALVYPVNIDLPLRVLLVLSGAAAVSFLPNFVVIAARRKRCDEVQRSLPEAIDLLEICVSAGMGMDMAWNSVTDEIRRVSDVLADEMALTNLEIHLGTYRAEAVQNMADRTEADELSSLAGVLAQAEQFGTSISDALRSFASSMREIRSQRAEESAEKMAVKLLLPMIMFIFPTVIIVTVGPASIRLVDILGG